MNQAGSSFFSDHPLLELRDATGGYGGPEIIHGLTLQVAKQEIVALLGHNGAGKSTLLRWICGMIPFAQGSFALDGQAIKRRTPAIMLRHGVSYSPQGGRVFGDLSVRENIALASALADETRRLPLEQALEFIPHLKKRLASKAKELSGGERQMLVLACGISTGARLLLLDEPSLGLAPSQVDESFQHLRQCAIALGFSVLLADQRIKHALPISNRYYVLRQGVITGSGTAAPLPDAGQLRQAMFGLKDLGHSM